MQPEEVRVLDAEDRRLLTLGRRLVPDLRAAVEDAERTWTREDGMARRLRGLELMADPIEDAPTRHWVSLIDLDALAVLDPRPVELSDEDADYPLRFAMVPERLRASLRRLAPVLSRRLGEVFPYGVSAVVTYFPELLQHPLIGWGLAQVRRAAGPTFRPAKKVGETLVSDLVSSPVTDREGRPKRRAGKPVFDVTLREEGSRLDGTSARPVMRSVFGFHYEPGGLQAEAKIEAARIGRALAGEFDRAAGRRPAKRPPVSR